MTDETRALLEKWRKEISEEIPEAQNALENAQAALASAREIEHRETDRIAQIGRARSLLTFSVGKDRPLANAIRVRMEDAVKMALPAPIRSLESARDAAEFRLNDLQDAIAQVGLMLDPAPRSQALATIERANELPPDDFEPIVMRHPVAQAVAE